VYIQDRWTKERLTLTLGVRYDFTNTSAPDQALGPAPSCQPSTTFPSVNGLRWHDITPKMGAS
jgi:outer membrane receptor protein involved in Fe transport